MTIADKGMTSKLNYGWLQQHGMRFICGESKRIRQVVRDGLARAESARRQQPAEIREREFIHLEPGAIPILQEENGVEREVLLPVRHIYCYNPDTAVRQRAHWERDLDGLFDLAAELKASGRSAGECYHQLRTYVQKHGISRQVQVPEDPVQDELTLVDRELVHESDSHGWFVVSTDTSSETGFTPEEVIGHYKRLQVVERGFRTLKSTLDLRPMFHWTPDRIRAHVMICFMALQLSVCMSLRLRRISMTFERAFGILRQIGVVTWQSGHGIHRAQTSPDGEQLRIFEVMCVPKPTTNSLVVPEF